MKRYLISFNNKQCLVKANSMSDAIRKVKDFDKNTTYEEYEKSGKFDQYQLFEIRTGLEKRVDVSKYADPKYDWEQMEQIKFGLQKGFDVSKYANPKFEVMQMREIYRGLEKHLDVSKYADPKFDDEQMQQIRGGLLEGVDVSKYANPNYDWRKMKDIREELLVKGWEYKDSIKDADVAEYQKWVDYDMKKYGHISKETNQMLRENGLEVIKDKYGDYEVIPKEKDGHFEDDIEKSQGGWVNRGKEGTHGKFATKREAREQQKAMFARGYRGDSRICDSNIKFLYPIVEFTESDYTRLRDLVNRQTTLDRLINVIEQAETAKDKNEIGYDKTYVDLVFSIDGKEKRVHIFRYDIGSDNDVDGLKREIENFVQDVVSGRKKITYDSIHDSLNVDEIKRDVERAVKDYFHNDLNILDYTTIRVFQGASGIMITVGSEAGYDEMKKLAKYLDRIIAKYDSSAKFEVETQWMISAILQNNYTQYF